MDCQPRYIGMVYKWLNNEHNCVLCDLPARQPYPLCAECEVELPWLVHGCRVCALPLPLDGLTCGACHRRRPAFQRVEALWYYGFPIDSLITRFKHQARWPLGRVMADVLGMALQHRFAEGLSRPDRLIPVPLARRRLRQRGFNQAAMLAQWLSKTLSIDCDLDRVARTRDTPAQQQLQAAARRRNLRQAFQVLEPEAVEGLHLAIVDDVLTTGATAQALASLLRQAGARRVDVYCLARTAKPGHV
ncbi:ComF family protein [Pseudomonas entomophila]|uniref:ComF family protein n=1 Tax=Pseudomonas entomophila TaxID=312306 RepID=UPI003EB88E6D